MGAGKGIEESPTWRIAVFVVLFFAISVCTEFMLHKLQHYLQRERLVGMEGALRKVKDELMLLGFISLTLLVVENDLAKICLNNDPFWDSWGGVRCSEHSTPATDSTDNCPDGQRAFLDIRAMHQVHVLIFVVAIIHVTFACFCLGLADWTMKRWIDWECWGDHPSETLDLLRPPPKYYSKSYATCANFWNQFTKTIGPFDYVAIRRYYMVKNRKPEGFVFRDQLHDVLQSEFENVVGISSWMWLLLIFQNVGDGYHFGKFYILNIISVLLTMLSGTKLVANGHHISRGVLEAYGTRESGDPDMHATAQDVLDWLRRRDNEVTQATLDRLQNAGDGTSASRIANLEPSFFMNRPKVFLQIVRFSLFVSAVVLAEMLFYRWQVGSEACFFDDRPWALQTVMQIVSFGALLLNGAVTVPMYAIVSATAHHTPHYHAHGHAHAHGHHEHKPDPKKRKCWQSDCVSSDSDQGPGHGESHDGAPDCAVPLGGGAGDREGAGGPRPPAQYGNAKDAADHAAAAGAGHDSVEVSVHSSQASSSFEAQMLSPGPPSGQSLRPVTLQDKRSTAALHQNTIEIEMAAPSSEQPATRLTKMLQMMDEQIAQIGAHQAEIASALAVLDDTATAEYAFQNSAEMSMPSVEFQQNGQNSDSASLVD